MTDLAISLLGSFQAWIALAQGALHEAIQFSNEELNAAQNYSFSWVIVDALGFLGWEARVLGDEDLAVQRCEEALKLTNRVGPGSLYIAYYVLGRVAISRRQYARASVYLKELVTHIDSFESPHKAAIESPLYILGSRFMESLPPRKLEFQRHMRNERRSYLARRRRWLNT